MRKKLLSAALLTSLAATGIGTSVRADATSNNFTISASSPGTLSFTGSGTAQFNNSLGTNNSFQVGSATSLGVNASSSSTPEYGVTSMALLNLGTDTQLKQTIGTSGASTSHTNTATRAHDVARSSMVERGWDVEYSADRTYSNGKQYSSQADYEVDYNAEYNSSYQNAYSNIRSSETSSGQDGTISGSFRTVENSRAGAGGNSGDWESTASAAVNVEYGADYQNRSGSYSAMSEVEWKAARESAYNREYASASASNNRFSDSQVTVQGIGSDATIAADADSSFQTQITSNTGLGDAGSTATAQGAAGASLSTVSLANQSQSQTASAFIQAFGNE
jgi:hypothetical protein